MALLNHINFGPPLSNRQAMATISLAMSHGGAAVSRPSMIDPNQIQSPMPNPSVLMHELSIIKCHSWLLASSNRSGNCYSVPVVRDD
ncbi:hypothetical protein Tco_0184898 [Tanacetum coccineum]